MVPRSCKEQLGAGIEPEIVGRGDQYHVLVTLALDAFGMIWNPFVGLMQEGVGKYVVSLLTRLIVLCTCFLSAMVAI